MQIRERGRKGAVCCLVRSADKNVSLSVVQLPWITCEIRGKVNYHSVPIHATSTNGHYARRLRHCSSDRWLAPTSRNVLFDAPCCLSGTHFLHLSSEATHCLYSNLGYFVGPLTSTHNRLPPAPLKLRPYGALQICLYCYCYFLSSAVKRAKNKAKIKSRNG